MSYVYGNVVDTFVDSLSIMAVCMISTLHHGLDSTQAKENRNTNSTGLSEDFIK